MDILILTCGTGGGHNAAAAAIREEALRQGHRATVLNPYTLHSEALAQHIDRAYISLVQRAPHLFGALYTLGDSYRRLPFHSPVYALNGMMAPRMAEYLSGHPADVVVMTHIFPGQILTQMREQGMAVPKTVLVATDYTCIPFSEECSADAYVVPSRDLAEEFAAKGIPRRRIYPLGIPVSRRFSQAICPEEARARLGLDPEKQYILTVGGSMGAGRPQQLLRRLLQVTEQRRDVEVISVCGNNRAMEQKLRRAFGERVHVVGQTQEMPLYLRSCALYLTKPGGLSTTEAAVSGVPLGLLATIPGCETHNLRFFEERGMCLRVSAREESLRRFVALLEDPAACEAMRRCQSREIAPDAARRIVELADALTRPSWCFSAPFQWGDALPQA